MFWDENNIPDQNGRVVVVTGANSGIGLEASRILAAKGAHVILACRNEALGIQAVEAIAGCGDNIIAECRSLDLSDLGSVKAFAADLLRDMGRLDLLVNNAGVMMCPESKTVDGFEYQFGTNFLGHYALTGLVLDLMNRTAGARVISLSSVAHRPAQIDFDNLNAELGYNSLKAYQQSKLACLMFAYELQRRLESAGKSTASLAAHPGVASSGLGRHSKIIRAISSLIAQDTRGGALPILRAACDPQALGGEYYGPSGFKQLRGRPDKQASSKYSYDGQTAKKLWGKAEELCGIRYSF